MRYCTACAGELERRVPPGDTLPRQVCSRCGSVHYENPKVVVGCIAHHAGRVLLCRRAIEPRRGLWTVPAGFFEMGETAEDAAVRETLEEACAQVTVEALYGVYSVPAIGHLYVIYRGHALDAACGPGPESLECAWFAEDEVPWTKLAFEVIGTTLREYFADQRRGEFPVRSGVIQARRE